MARKPRSEAAGGVSFSAIHHLFGLRVAIECFDYNHTPTVAFSYIYIYVFIIVLMSSDHVVSEGDASFSTGCYTREASA
jgi:hypothetical protein